MIYLKKLLITIFLLSILTCLYVYRIQIIKYVMVHLVYHDTLSAPNSNSYAREKDWGYVKKTNNFNPKNKQEILNLFYTALDGGWDALTFYCADSYTTCISDVRAITEDNYILSNINNFVTTLNAYNRIFVDMSSLGRVNIQFERLYTEQKKSEIEEKVNQLYQELITDDMDTEEKIRTIHDYIINHTVYDKVYASTYNEGRQFSDSNTAYGPLFTGKAVCGGYTDAMALFLDKMEVPNYKISSSKHIWNLVYVNNEWKHLDLTWDDPVVSTNENLLLHTFFLISTEALERENTNEHNYDKTIYIEAK